jgi:DNA polymerase III epsilon subunit-like protein
VLLDTETTGLEARTDEIIELGMVKLDYLPDGRIAGVRDTFSAFNEPSVPIPPEITALTGITAEMVTGQRFDDAAVTAFVEDAATVIAHVPDPSDETWSLLMTTKPMVKRPTCSVIIEVKSNIEASKMLLAQ